MAAIAHIVSLTLFNLVWLGKEGGGVIIWTSTIINIYSKFVLVSVIFGYID